MLKVKNTRRQRRSASPPLPQSTVDVPDAVTSRQGMASFFDAESANAFMKPWLRLERGLRLQKLRQFSEEYPGLSAEERETLNRVLVKANDARVLNTKQQIQYEEGRIQSIRGLRMTRVGDAPATFRIEAVRPTKKRGREDTRSDDRRESDKEEGEDTPAGTSITNTKN